MIGYLNHPDSSTKDEACSGFFITLRPMPALNRKYMVVGEIISGLVELEQSLSENSQVRELQVSDCWQGEGIYLNH